MKPKNEIITTKGHKKILTHGTHLEIQSLKVRTHSLPFGKLACITKKKLNHIGTRTKLKNQN